LDICPNSRSKIKEYSDKWDQAEKTAPIQRLLLFDPPDDHPRDTDKVFLINDFGKLFTVFKMTIKDSLIFCDKQVFPSNLIID
jgi:hypothetical protein